MSVDMCAGKCAGKCADMCADMRMDMCLEIYIEMYLVVCIDVCIHMHVDNAYMCRSHVVDLIPIWPYSRGHTQGASSLW